jgi:tRNA-2-methylthio-N6-dimethylallyladenosine synthase
MNDDDSEQLALFMEQSGYLPVADPAEADVVLLNTCSVRSKPEDKVFSKLGELAERKRDRPEMVIGVCGCMAQVEAKGIARRAPSVAFIVGPGLSSDVPALVTDARARYEQGVDAKPRIHLGADERSAILPIRSPSRPARVRAHVPVMYGCDRHCTFCIVPHTRGQERSRPVGEIVGEVRRLAASGTKEITLLGQTVNSYGRRLPGLVTFDRLLRALSAVEGIERIRFTSPHPRGFTDRLIGAMASLPQVCEHVHLPLQAADDDLLRAMKRGYTVEQFREIVRKLRAAIPGVAITTDIMLGFPGETDAQFEATMDFVRETRFDAAFMFAYSPRRGTKAATMPGQVSRAVKVARLSALIEMQNAISAEINRGLVGSMQEVLVDGRSARDPERWTGLTRTHKTTHIEALNADGSPASLAEGRTVRVRVTEGRLTGLVGCVVGAADGAAGLDRAE